MRVLITTDAVGGVWTFTRELAMGLASEGCGVALVCIGSGPTADQASWVADMRSKYQKSFRFDMIDTPLEWEQENERAFSAAAPALVRIAEDFCADLIHSSQFCFGALRARVPVIVTAHSDVLSWAAACGTALDNSIWLQRYRNMMDEGLSKAAAITAPTRWMLSALGASSCAERASVIPNGRDLRQADAVVRKLQAVTAGRLWDEAKGIGVLADVCTSLPILIAGSNTHDNVEAPNAVGQAQLLGLLNEADVLALFQASAVYICTSLYEPFGLAPLEAALCGCALVCRDISSLREVWGEAAVYFQDAAALSSILNRLYESPALLAHIQARCLSRAGLYTRDAMVEAYMALYCHTIAKAAGVLEGDCAA